MDKLGFPQNPLLGAEYFIPDAEAHVWADGRLYIYGSFDIKGNMGYCSREYHVFSTDNMIDWTDHGVSFKVDDIVWLDENEKKNCVLYAPDCAYRDGRYYLYYCIPDGRCGVASSSSPVGPFEDIKSIEGIHGIDPAVFIDDDGQAYIYWGQFDAVRAAKLCGNMTDIVMESVVQPLSVAEHDFHEGSSVKKVNGKYIFTYTDTHRHKALHGGLGMATSIGYAVSDDPMTGYKYGGVIVDNIGCDPDTWNNHGSIECFGGQWYVFYHRSTHASNFSRHVCAEPIEISPDGKISEVKLTSGMGETIPACTAVPAHLSCLLGGNVRIAGDDASAHTLALTDIRPGSRALYRYIGFECETVFRARLRGNGCCRVLVIADGEEIGALECRLTAEYTDYRADISAVGGRHELTLYFDGKFADAAIDEIAFEK